MARSGQSRTPHQTLGWHPRAVTNGTVQSPDVSATPSRSQPEFPHVIQHSATINSGNSGGPLLNDRGELVGINTLYNPGEDRPIENQFYAITTDHAKPIVDQLARGEDQANPGWNVAAFAEVPLSSFFEETGFGTAEVGQRADEILIEQGVDGVLVTGVDAGSPAEEAAVATGDLLTSLKGTPVTSVAEVCEVLQSARPGETLETQDKYITSRPRRPERRGRASFRRFYSAASELLRRPRPPRRPRRRGLRSESGWPASAATAEPPLEGTSVTSAPSTSDASAAERPTASIRTSVRLPISRPAPATEIM